MKITKYRHACLTITENERTLIIDPGSLSTDFDIPEHVEAIIITHEHSDHLDPVHIKAIVAKNPDVLIIGDEAVVAQLPNYTTKAVHTGEIVTAGMFTLQFFGGEHARIHTSIPVIANLGVLVNDTLYYPGDSFAIPGVAVKVLALPVSAPWLKMSEVMDFLVAIHPRLVFPTHDALLSDTGNQLVDRMLTGLSTANGIEYQRVTTTIDV